MITGPVSDSNQALSLSRMIGRKTVKTSSSARQRSSQLFMPFSGKTGSSESTQLRETELIRPSELRQLPPEASIILAPGTPPILASKAIWFTRTEMQTLVQDARAGAASDQDDVAPASGDDSVSPAGNGGAESVGDVSAVTSDARSPASIPPPDPARSKSSDTLEGAIEEGRFQGSTDSGVDTVGAGDQSETEIAAIGEGEVHSPSDHARPEPGAGLQDKDGTAGELATADKVAPQPPMAPNVTGRDPAAWALAQGWLVGPDDADDASVSGGDSDHRPTSLIEEVTESAGDESAESAETRRQDLAVISVSEDVSPEPCVSPDKRVSHGSEDSTGQGVDPVAEDKSEGEIDAVEEGEAHSSGEHAPQEPDARLQDVNVSAVEPETAGKAPSQPSIAPDSTSRNPEARASAQGRRVGPVDLVDASAPVGDSNFGAVSSGEEARDPADDESDATPASDVDPGLRAAIVNRAVYDSIVTRAVSTKSCPAVEKVLTDPSVEVPAGTQPRVIPPGTLGSGVDHADAWSLVFVPDDGRSPVHRILFDKDGVIVGRVGPYHRA